MLCLNDGGTALQAKPEDEAERGRRQITGKEAAMAGSRLGLETKALTEGAVMAALTAVLALAGIYMPLLGMLAALVWTLPVVAICLRHGMKAGVLAMAAAGLIILMAASPITALTMVIPCAGPALLLGEALRKGWPTGRTVFLTTVMTALCTLLSAGLAALLTGISPWEDWLMLKDSLRQGFETAMPLYESMGMLKQLGVTSQQFAAQIEASLNLLEYLLPAVLLLSALLSAGVNYILAHKIFSRLKIKLPPLGHFYQYRQPWWQIWIFIAAFAVTMFAPQLFPGQPRIAQAAGNLMLFYCILFFLQGLAVLAFYSRKLSRGVGILLRAFLIVVLLSGNLIIPIVLVLAGIVDIFADFRKLGDYD